MSELHELEQPVREHKLFIYMCVRMCPGAGFTLRVNRDFQQKYKYNYVYVYKFKRA